MLHKVIEYRLRVKHCLTCKEALQASNYKGPPELMSMYLCFLKAVDRISTHFIKKHCDLLRKTREEYKKQHRQNPVLKELVKIVRARLRTDASRLSPRS